MHQFGKITKRESSFVTNSGSISPVSLIVANLYIEHFEQLALETAHAPPRLWLRYVDDTFTICLQDKIEELADHINSIDSAIKFT